MGDNTYGLYDVPLTDGTVFFDDVQMAHRRDRLKSVKFPVLSKGFIQLIDTMGSDRRIVDAARTTSNLGGKGDADDANLIRYLMRHRHSTPSEFCELTLLVKCPMDVWRQWIRHRTASVNEFSSRYSEVPDENDTTESHAWRLQSQGNRQGSAGEMVSRWPENAWLMTREGKQLIAQANGQVRELNPATDQVGEPRDLAPEDVIVSADPDNTGRPLHNQEGFHMHPGDYLSAKEVELHNTARRVYEQRLEFGVAKEQARKDLCLSQYTVAYWKCNLHNLMHFLGLRMDSHAQIEIRSYANVIGDEIVARLFPVSWHAFRDYRLNALTLTAIDQEILQRMLERDSPPYNYEAFLDAQPTAWAGKSKVRERDEAVAKFQKLKLMFE